MRMRALICMMVVCALASCAGPSKYYDSAMASYGKKDFETAYTLFLKAAEQDNARAFYYIGGMNMKGQGVKQDYREALKWLKRAADRGYAPAQYDYGYMYYSGEGVSQDYKEAMKWFRLSAEQGNSIAQTKIGYMYHEGQGVRQDYKEAIKWFRLAAEQGDALGQFDLGYMYEKGQGLPSDPQEARRWYQRAADKGSETARKNLARLDDGAVGILEGIWVPESTVRTLKETFSPISCRPEMIIISRNADRRWKFTWANFHEGSWRYILGYASQAGDRSKGTLRLSKWESPMADDTPEGLIQVDTGLGKSGSVLWMSFNSLLGLDHNNERFVKIPVELDRYANELLIAGNWHDRDKRSYVFTPDGAARWPDGSFHYEISMDKIEAGCDYIKVAVKGEPGVYKRYGFKRTKDTLSLYTIVYDRDMPISCEDTPFVVLKRDDSIIEKNRITD